MGALKPLVWPDRPTRLDRNGLALLLVELPAGASRVHARQLAREVSREVLAGLLGLPLEQVALVEGPRGPVLEGAGCKIRLSLSYAGDRVLIGLAEGRALGVDIVRIDRLPEVEALARLYLPVVARQAVLEASPELRDARFAHGWARMEACGKCLGLPLMEISAERDRALEACCLVACEQVDGYRIAVALGSG